MGQIEIPNLCFRTPEGFIKPRQHKPPVKAFPQLKSTNMSGLTRTVSLLYLATYCVKQCMHIEVRLHMFGDSRRFSAYTLTTKMEEPCFFETSVNLYQTTKIYIPQDDTFISTILKKAKDIPPRN
jgi:hypothetical protein